MKKSDLMNFIEAVRAKALKSVQDRYDVQILEAKKRLLNEKDFTSRIEIIQEQYNSLFEKVQELVLDMKTDKQVRYEEYYNPAYYSSNFIGKTKIFDNVIKTSKFEESRIKGLESKRDKELDEIKNEYSKVWNIANSMVTPKKIADYLKELGFDISSVESKDCVSITANINKAKLFVCGENK